MVVAGFPGLKPRAIVWPSLRDFGDSPRRRGDRQWNGRLWRKPFAESQGNKKEKHAAESYPGKLRF